MVGSLLSIDKEPIVVKYELISFKDYCVQTSK